MYQTKPFIKKSLTDDDNQLSIVCWSYIRVLCSWT